MCLDIGGVWLCPAVKMRDVIVIQRVRVRWGATARDSRHADARRGLDGPVLLPSDLPDDEVVVHDVLADEADGYQRREQKAAGGIKVARDFGLWVRLTEGEAVVDRMSGWVAYPRPGVSYRIFTLAVGEVGRYRANFRFSGYSVPWYYENWVVHISNGPVAPDRFLHGPLAKDIDNRVHLYGGR